MTFAHRVFCIKVVTVIVLMGLWEGLARSGLVYSGVVPPLQAVLRALMEQLFDTTFYYDLGITMLATSVGFLAGAIISPSVPSRAPEEYCAQSRIPAAPITAANTVATRETAVKYLRSSIGGLRRRRREAGDW